MEDLAACCGRLLQIDPMQTPLDLNSNHGHPLNFPTFSGHAIIRTNSPGSLELFEARIFAEPTSEVFYSLENSEFFSSLLGTLQEVTAGYSDAY